MTGETLTADAFHEAEKKATAGGTKKVTEEAEQRLKDTGKVNPLVDPAEFGVIRRSISRKEQQGEFWVLLVGIAMAIEQLLDTTGSMGGNVEIALRVLKTAYELFKSGKKPVLGRYDIQIATSIFGDVTDRRVLLRSQFEMAKKIVEQMGYMAPEKDGGDPPEDQEYGLFAAAYLTAAEITTYGLRSYHFMITDAESHGRIDMKNLIRVFGPDVLKRLEENGHSMERGRFPRHPR